MRRRQRKEAKAKECEGKIGYETKWMDELWAIGKKKNCSNVKTLTGMGGCMLEYSLPRLCGIPPTPNTRPSTAAMTKCHMMKHISFLKASGREAAPDRQQRGICRR
jgi:hypothetical protein